MLRTMLECYEDDSYFQIISTSPDDLVCRQHVHNKSCVCTGLVEFGKRHDKWTKGQTGCSTAADCRTEMIADYSAEIKIAIFKSIWKRQRDE